MAEADAFELRALAPGDTFSGMKSGDAAFAALSSFAKSKAHKYEAANLARTYVIYDGALTRIAAYVTLVCSEVVSSKPILQADDPEFPFGHFPAVKIARLLVDKRYREKNSRGFGRTLVDFSLGIARSEICPAVGCRFVVVDAKQASVKFYEKCGFTLVDTAANRARTEPVMYIDLHKAAA